MMLVLVLDNGSSVTVADDRRLRAAVTVCSKGPSRSSDSTEAELGAAVIEAAADAAGEPYMGVRTVR